MKAMSLGEIKMYILAIMKVGKILERSKLSRCFPYGHGGRFEKNSLTKSLSHSEPFNGFVQR